MFCFPWSVAHGKWFRVYSRYLVSTTPPKAFALSMCDYLGLNMRMCFVFVFQVLIFSPFCIFKKAFSNPKAMKIYTK